MADLPNLTINQKRFLKYYLEDPSNAALAARKAGYSPKSSNEIAHQLLNNARLLPYLELAVKNGELDTGISEEDIYGQLKGMSETNIFDLVTTENGRAVIVKNLDDIPYEYGQYIQALKETSNGIEVKFYDKTKVLDMLAKMKNMYERHQQSGSQSVELSYPKPDGSNP